SLLRNPLCPIARQPGTRTHRGKVSSERGARGAVHRMGWAATPHQRKSIMANNQSGSQGSHKPQQNQPQAGQQRGQQQRQQGQQKQADQQKQPGQQNQDRSSQSAQDR